MRAHYTDTCLISYWHTGRHRHQGRETTTSHCSQSHVQRWISSCLASSSPRQLWYLGTYNIQAVRGAHFYEFGPYFLIATSEKLITNVRPPQTVQRCTIGDLNRNYFKLWHCRWFTVTSHTIMYSILHTSVSWACSELFNLKSNESLYYFFSHKFKL